MAKKSSVILQEQEALLVCGRDRAALQTQLAPSANIA